jgi:putative ABC transport system permease protein
MTLPLSELQAVTGTTGTDPATIVTVRLTDNASAPVVEERLQRAYPSYDVRTNREQLESTVQRQAVVVAGGASLVVLSVIAGLALTLNVLLSMLQRQRREFAALKAVGCSSTTLAGVAAVQALVVGVVGAVVGVGLTFPIAWGLDQVALALTGFENVVRTTPAVVAGGAVAALATGLLTSVVGAVWLRLLRPLETLE